MEYYCYSLKRISSSIPHTDLQCYANPEDIDIYHPTLTKNWLEMTVRIREKLTLWGMS